MKLWRLTRAPFVALDGAGPQRHGARWTSPGQAVVNFAADPGLAVLVVLRYLPRDLDGIDQDYVLGWTQSDAVPEMLPFAPDPIEKRRIGDEWRSSGRSLLAQVSSAVLPESSLILANPEHPAFAGIAALKTRPFSFEECLHLPPM